MPIIDKDGNVGYYEWESRIDYEWLGIPRDANPPPAPLQEQPKMEQEESE